MENQTEFNSNFSRYYHNYNIIMRVNSVAIFVENLLVVICLLTHRNKFSKKEFWLHLLCLSINDLFVGITLFMLSFKDSVIFSKSVGGCVSLMVLVAIPQLALPYIALSICIYRYQPHYGTRLCNILGF